MAKIARVQISKEYFELILRGEFRLRPNATIETDAPKDLEVIGLSIPQRFIGFLHTLEVYVKSESFADVPEGSEPPVISPFVYKVNYD
jgi:hypothetical protein